MFRSQAQPRFNPDDRSMPRLRWVLHIQAQFWRVLMDLGMFFQRLTPPRPRQPAFKKTIQSTISKTQGQIYLYFYVPPQYERQGRQSTSGQAAADELHRRPAHALKALKHSVLILS
ncbi:hypothetical protein WHR41_09129 [Cladosporium halotolerans]|uniref:Uncharacterized protein n=1 Tax=Cladosporium halotolerans TaxID=1052096 RepID=A0AB34KEQ8_9PEZI